MYSSSLIENQVTALAFTEELNRIAEAHLPEIEKCSAFLSPAHAALVLGAPAVIGAAGGALGAAEGGRVKGALLGIPAGYLGALAGIATGLDATGIPSALIGSGGGGYLAGRALRRGSQEAALRDWWLFS